MITEPCDVHPSLTIVAFDISVFNLLLINGYLTESTGAAIWLGVGT